MLGEFFYDTTSGGFKNSQVTLNSSFSQSQCKKYCLIFGFFFNSLAELYKIPVWLGFSGRAPHSYNPQSHCLNVAVPLRDSHFRNTMCFQEFKGGRIQLPCNISTGKSGWVVCSKYIIDRWNLFLTLCLYIGPNHTNITNTDSVQEQVTLPDLNMLHPMSEVPF